MSKVPTLSPTPDMAAGLTSTDGRRSRRKRLQLSCGECRDKKLSCDRKLPCHRCVRSGRPEQCSFETKPSQGSQLNELRDLRAEVSHLKELLLNTRQDNFQAPNDIDSRKVLGQGHVDTSDEPTDPTKRSPNGFHNQHCLLQFFGEIPQLFPFIKETADEWLKPLGVNLKKTKPATGPSQETLESLLPSKTETDHLVSFYLDQFERLHRIIYIPAFKREYANFWIPGQPRYPSMTALVLCMISISSSVSGESKSMPLQWISACENWLRQASPKHRKLIHQQISCLIYLGKRMHGIGKKRWWKDTGSLVQNALMDGLHREPSPVISPYMREMRRRMWAVIRELDLQTSFEFELPTLLHAIDSDVAAPANIDDNLEEGSVVVSKPPEQITLTSYQHHSSRSWKLRLEISHRLFGNGKALTYDDSLRYTHEFTQEIGSLPPWDETNLLPHAFLQFQLKACVLALHRPYIQRSDGRFWLSETVSYQMSRDMLLLNVKMAQSGIQGLTLLREDLLLASLNLTRITNFQPRESTWVAMDSDSTIDLLEQCLLFMEITYLRSCSGEPWCFMTMCAAIMLLKIHVGKESWETAKSACAQRFLDLHYKRMGNLLCQDPMDLTQLPPGTIPAKIPTSEWLDNNYPDMGSEWFNFDMELEGWGSENLPSL